MSDVRFILGIKNEPIESDLKLPLKNLNRKKRKFEMAPDSKTQPTKKKRTGLAREIASLATSSSQLFPTVDVTTPEISKPKPKFQDNSSEGKWVYKTINSSANPKFLVKHWAKSNESSKDYVFAKYSKMKPLLQYSDQDYQKYFALNSDNW